MRREKTSKEGNRIVAVQDDSSGDTKSPRAPLHRAGVLIRRCLGQRRQRLVGLWCVWVVLLGLGWNTSSAAPLSGSEPLSTQARGANTTDGLRQRQVAFLHRLRQSDPRYETIEKAVFNARNELGVILDRRVEMDAVRPLLRTILTQMARTFPGNDLTVIVYTPSQPPREIGTARLQARSREMTYTPAVPH